jgi:Zn-dependent membrane protease YugP
VDFTGWNFNDHSSGLLLVELLFLRNLFSIVTLPVEYDASNRALMLETKECLRLKNRLVPKISKMAARTHVVAALGSIATLFYYISIYMEEEETNSSTFISH